MNSLDLHLAEAASSNDVPSLTRVLSQLDLNDPTTEVRDSAGGPLADLTCRASLRTLEEEGALDPSVVESLLAGLSSQRRLLSLNDAVDALLGNGPFVQQYGQLLCDSLLRGHARTLRLQPLVAAGFLEGALRLAIVDAAKPLKVLVAMDVDDPADVAPEYSERLPRLLGAALDRWSNDESIASTLRNGLRQLRDVSDAAADATFECGLDLLRQAANAQATTALALLLEARQQMATAAAAEEARHDAALYGAGIDAIFAFSRADHELLAASRESVRQILDQREAWLAGLHAPAWRRPRRDAERAWARLILILDNAAEQLAAPAWLEAWDALATVLEAYEMDRSLSPVPGTAELAGLQSIVQPRVEGAIVRQQSLLATLRHATEVAQRAASPPLPVAQLAALSDRIDHLTERPDQHQHRREPEDAEEGDRPTREELVAKIPSVLSVLGEQKAGTLAQGVSGEILDLFEGIAYRKIAEPAGGPTVEGLIRKLSAGLASCPDYVGTTRQYFDLLIWDMATFLATRHDLQLSGTIAYLKPFPAGAAPHEERLQTDYADWLRRGRLAGRIQVEVSNVATGRVDIQVGFGTTRFCIEVKRELSDARNVSLQESYLTQASDYSGTNAALGQLLVLDLTKHPDGVRHLSECAWVAAHQPTNSTVDRYVVVGVVIGNRDTPRSYSR